jgi:hypothetical protein
MSNSKSHSDSHRCQDGGAAQKAPRRRSPGKLPKGGRFFRCPSVDPNPTNPVASLSPEHRAAQRVKLISTVMARLAVAAGEPLPDGGVTSKATSLTVPAISDPQCKDSGSLPASRSLT